MTGNLYIQVAPKDDGSRPFNACDNAWTNQSIWLTGGLDQTTTQVGNVTTINVRVKTSGATAVDFVKVQAWVMSSQVGLVSPAQALATFTSGLATVVPGAGGTILSCDPWTPTSDQLQVSPQHICLIANAFQDPNAADPPFDGRFLQPSDKFAICDDAHQGQRNIALKPHPPVPPGAGQAQFFDVQVIGSDNPKVDMSLQVATLPARMLGPDEWQLLNSQPKIERTMLGGRTRLGIVSPETGEFQRLRFSRLRPKTSFQFAQFDKVPEVRFKGGTGPQMARVDLGVTGEEPVGTVHAFDIVLRTARGAQIGAGMRVLTVVVPE